MLLDFALPEHERKLIPEGRISGPMPWVIAIMLFLTLLAAATGLLLVGAAQQGGDDIASRVTIQIIEANPVRRAAQRVAVSRVLRNMPALSQIKPIADADVRELLAPWLGGDVVDADIPIPALIDVTFAVQPDKSKLASLARQIRPIAPNIRIDSHATWLAPYYDLMRALILLSAGVLLLLLLATSATVILAVRSALNTHRETIEIMHMMGGTDVQAARLFQRRVALDALLGGAIGFGAAAMAFWFISARFAAVESGLLTGSSMPWYGWVVLSLIPLGVTMLAMFMARITVLSALKKML
jgi:cell division transport system permease protein